MLGSVIFNKIQEPSGQFFSLGCSFKFVILVRKLDLLEFCLTSVFRLAVYCGSSSDFGMCSLGCSDGQMVLRYYLVVLPGLVLDS